jgi:soluble cytochrome b562
MKNQKNRIFRTAIYLVILLLAGPSFFELGAAQTDGSSVSDSMKAINRGLRELRRQIDDPEKTEANLGLIAKVREQVKLAQKGEPSKTSSLAEAEKGPFLEAYRALLDEVVLTLNKLERAVKEERLEDASALLKELNEHKKQGHSKFQD